MNNKTDLTFYGPAVLFADDAASIKEAKEELERYIAKRYGKTGGRADDGNTTDAFLDLEAARQSASAYASAHNRRGSIPKSHVGESSEQKAWREQAIAYVTAVKRGRGTIPRSLPTNETSEERAWRESATVYALRENERQRK